MDENLQRGQVCQIVHNTSGTLGQEWSVGGIGQLPSDGVYGKVW